MRNVMRAAVLLVGALPATVPAALAGHPGPPLAGSAGSVDIDYLRVLLALVVCLALAVLALWWIKRQTGHGIATALGRRRGQSVRVVERARLNARAMLHVVEFDGKRILVATDNNGVFRIAQGELQDSTGTQTTAQDPEARP